MGKLLSSDCSVHFSVIHLIIYFIFCRLHVKCWHNLWWTRKTKQMNSAMGRFCKHWESFEATFHQHMINLVANVTSFNSWSCCLQSSGNNKVLCTSLSTAAYWCQSPHCSWLSFLISNSNLCQVHCRLSTVRLLRTKPVLFARLQPN